MRSVADAGVGVDVMFVDGRTSRMAYLRAATKAMALNFRRRRYDLIHAHTGHCGAVARLQWRYPVLVSYVGYDLYGKPRACGGITIKSRIEAALFRQLSRFVRSTITKSSQMESLLPAASRPRNTVLPNGVDRRMFRPIQRLAARRRLGWPDDELVVLFAADPAVSRKRYDLARAGCEAAATDVSALRLRICSGRRQEELALAMNAADVLLVTSIAEGSPNVVKEALACDLPIVTSDVGDVRTVLDGVSRCRVIPADPDAVTVAAALRELLAEAPARSDGRASSTNLAVDVVAAQLVAVYERVRAARWT
jgi:glycosyltransferase involved in cell wall biosynthesis